MTATSTESLVDVRPLPARERHPAIMSRWHALEPGESLVLVNDHDPLPLYYQFLCEHRGKFHWDYLEGGPAVWRVRITRGDFADPGFHPVSKMASMDLEAPASRRSLELDLRPIFARGETPCTAIDEAAARILPGQSLVLLVPFQPVPLYSKLGRQGFCSQSRQLEDGTWRIEFTRAPGTSAGPVESCACSGA